MMQNNRTRPSKSFKVGAVRVAIWSNPRLSAEGKAFDSHKVMIERTYRDGANGFKTTGSLNIDDIPKAILALSRAYEFLICQPAKTDGAVQGAKEFNSAAGFVR